MLPHYLALGVTKNEFMHSTLIGLRVYDEAYKIKREMIDEQSYFMGVYVFEAVSVAIGNALRKKNTEPIKYRDTPILQDIKANEHEKHLSEDEKMDRVNALFDMLGGMQKSFEASKKGGGH